MTCEYTYCKPMLGSLDPQSLNTLLRTTLYPNFSSSNNVRGPKCTSWLKESPKDQVHRDSKDFTTVRGKLRVFRGAGSQGTKKADIVHVLQCKSPGF